MDVAGAVYLVLITVQVIKEKTALERRGELGGRRDEMGRREAHLFSLITECIIKEVARKSIVITVDVMCVRLTLWVQTGCRCNSDGLHFGSSVIALNFPHHDCCSSHILI